MIQVADIRKAYGAQVLFDDITFTVGRGERIGLVGRNGSGKTTLFKLILGTEQPDTGSISIPPRYAIGHVTQHIRFAQKTVITEAASCLPPSEDCREETYQAEKVLYGLGFTKDDLCRSPAVLSGGFQVRLNLARSILAAPDLLLLDEPTNYLDILSIRWLTQFLRNWKSELMLITHDRRFMDSVTTHTMMIHRRAVRKITGPTEKIYAQIAQDEEIYEKTRANDEKKRRQAEIFISRFRAKATKARAVQSRIKTLQKLERMDKLDEIEGLDFEFHSAPFPGKWPLIVEDLNFSHAPGGPELIRGFSCSVGKRDRIAVIGKNGKGKTTLLNLLAKEFSPTGGAVKHNDHLRLAYFGQTNVDRLAPDKTVLQEIIDSDPDLTHNAARSLCGVMMFDGDNALKKVSVLSGGERSRVLLGKVLARPANLLLLDEPTNHLDMDSVDSLVEAIEAFAGAVIIVTHSELVLDAVATRLIVFDGGSVRVFDGTYRDFLERGGWRDDHEVCSDVNVSGDAQKKEFSRKDHRRVRAEIIAERARVLSPLRKRITDTENDITRLEEQVNQNTRTLVAASAAGNGNTIGKLSKSIHEGKARIEALFVELEVLLNEHDEKSAAFEKRLGRLDVST